MEYYQSTCNSCGHHWTWTGYKTGLGKTEAQLESMWVAGKVCPVCEGGARVGLDFSSDEAKEYSRMFERVLGSLFAGSGEDQEPPESSV